MGGAYPAPRMRPVELVDDGDEADEGPWPTSDPARPGTGTTPDDATVDRLPGAAGRRVRRWVAVSLALAVVVGAVATAATERAARARADAFAALPGVVRPLDVVPQVRWRATADGPTPVLAAGGGIVTVSGAGGTWVVRGADAATGEERWRAELVESAGAGFESVAVACTVADPSSQVLCTWAEPDVVYGAADGTAPYVPPTRVEAIDATDGTRQGSWAVDGRVLDLVRHGDDVLVATALRDRRVTVERRAGTDGAVRWSWTSPVPVIDNGGLRARPELVASGHVVTLMGHWSTLFDIGTGRVLREVTGGGSVVVRALPDGGYATWEPASGGALHDADGRVRATLPALPAPVVGDGSAAGLLVDAGNRVLAVDAADGAVAWKLATRLTPLAVVDGVVVMADELTVGAADGHDGRLLWEHEVDTELLPGPLTDGLHVLAAEPAGGAYDLVARGLRDGVQVWRVELPPDARGVVPVGDRVVVRTPSEVLVLG